MTKWPLDFTDTAIAHDLLAERESATGRGTGTGGGTPGLAVEAGIEGGGPVPGPGLREREHADSRRGRWEEKPSQPVASHVSGLKLL